MALTQQNQINCKEAFCPTKKKNFKKSGEEQKTGEKEKYLSKIILPISNQETKETNNSNFLL